MRITLLTLANIVSMNIKCDVLGLYCNLMVSASLIPDTTSITVVVDDTQGTCMHNNSSISLTPVGDYRCSFTASNDI